MQQQQAQQLVLAAAGPGDADLRDCPAVVLVWELRGCGVFLKGVPEGSKYAEGQVGIQTW